MSTRVCCNCRHNIRIPKRDTIECRCEIDNHYISYCECMSGWCKRWAKDHTFDSLEQEGQNGP